jgi:2-polyprenyl-3-methyl-5-hydroxy-6-metoxy-1,4-benzoquinol methylase
MSLAAPCRVCGSTNTVLWKPRNLERELRPEDFRITDSHYGVTLTLHKCADCSFIFADESEIGQLVELYEQLVDPSYEEGAENRLLQMRDLLRLGKSAQPNAGTLLEIGAGSGLLVAEAGRMGLAATGVEPSKSLVAAARQINHVELIQGTFPHPLLEGRRFDLVFVVDVIEHVNDPVKLLADCAQALAPGGVLLVVTPDVSSLAARLLGQRWWHFRLAHVGYFNATSMSKAAARAGLEIRATRRVRWFFPIRYLAERAATYLPLGWLNRGVERVAPLRRVYDVVIPVNLHDSSAFIMARKD